ncbi:MAG: zinc ribbon domain-containing protein, partial [Candidatus Thorarchaeota archaeon]|nr:zinc ribbon domain-containing protein [Candidatus Thorarchaeota archaeon]
MRECPKCGKANQPTRKFCIRCAASLIAPRKPATISQPTPVAPPPIAQPTAPPQAPQAASGQASVTTGDQWVRPSEISKDRIRTAGGAKRKTELEKAREAFDRAESVGIDEAVGSGIVESRMLRASEVRELLEQTAEYSAAEA